MPRELKPLFIPLRTEWFRKFEDGSKTNEYRVYGPRWNERTCSVGRRAILSHGYSGNRLHFVVKSFSVLSGAMIPDFVKAIYPHAASIAVIGFEKECRNA